MAPKPPGSSDPRRAKPPDEFPEPPPCPGSAGALPAGAVWETPTFCPQAHPGAVPSTSSLAEPGPWHPTPLGGLGGHSRAPKVPPTPASGFFPIYLQFFPPKLQQIFPGHESWTSNPVPNPHHTIQLGQKSKTSHLSESRCKCFSPQAHNAEAVSEIADLYPFFSSQTL